MSTTGMLPSELRALAADAAAAAAATLMDAQDVLRGAASSPSEPALPLVEQRTEQPDDQVIPLCCTYVNVH